MFHRVIRFDVFSGQPAAPLRNTGSEEEENPEICAIPVSVAGFRLRLMRAIPETAAVMLMILRAFKWSSRINRCAVSAENRGIEPTMMAAMDAGTRFIPE